MAFEPLALQDLRKGMYIKLECSWWKHPFATNKFKVTSQKEIQVVKGISNLELYYDPELSDVVLSEEDSVTELAPSISVEDPPGQEEESTDQYPKEEVPSYLKNDREDRVAFLQKRRMQLKQTERSFEDSKRKAKAALRNIASGEAAGLGGCQQLTASLLHMLSHDKTVMALMEVMNAAEDEDPLVIHSMNVCVLSLLVGKELGLSEEELEELGIGALAHDVGFLSIPRRLNLTTAGFARGEADNKLHIRQGLSAIERVPDFPKQSLTILSQHHERLNGKGYPKGISGDEISSLAKIVMIVDEYDDLCHNPERSANLTPYEALSHMYQNAMVHKKGDFDSEIIVLLIQSLGVYPPGTIVELNDGTIGVVISINSAKRTKPQVMVYVKDIPRDEAVIADLAQDDHLAIEKSIRPLEVSREVKQYLNPHRLTGYFPSSKESPSESSLAGTFKSMAR